MAFTDLNALRITALVRPAFTNAEEDTAACFLRLCGFTVLSRNTRQHGAELDFLCSNAAGDLFIFEVKRRTAAKKDFYPAVSAGQRARLVRAAKELQRKANKFLTIRICLLLVDARRQSAELVLDI